MTDKSHKTMSIEQLVETITREVLRQLDRPPATSDVLLLASPEGDHVSAVLDKLRPDIRVHFWDGCTPPSPGQRVILPRLSCRQMADLAVGRAGEPLTEKVLALLLSGTTIEVFAYEYQRFQKTAPARLYALYESYVAILKGFGLCSFGDGAPQIASLKQTLVTEEDIVAAHKQGIAILKIPATARLTPLARDCARERGVQINQSERRNR